MKHEHSIDFVFVLALMCVFAISILLVLMNGVFSYEAVTQRMQENYESRTGTAYVTEKLRHCGELAKVRQGYVLEDPEKKGSAKVDALEISQEISGERYSTYIYYYNGFLREIFTNQGNMLPAETGSQILALKAFKVEPVEDGLIRIECLMKNGKSTFALVHTGGGLSYEET